jgi:murein DD-endopeptidase MepM/ murein hydrolase activator NlpD
MLLTVSLAAISGIVVRVSQVTQASGTFESQNQVFGTDDLLSQGGSINAASLQNSSGFVLKTIKHKVLQNETLDAIADQYKVSTDTIRWANSKQYSELFFTKNIKSGWILDLPEINGVVHTVRDGEDFDSIIAKYAAGGNSEANKFNIIEFNGLGQPVVLSAGQQLFIPDGNLRRLTPDGSLDSIPAGAFIDPLSHPSCNGYYMTRGFTSYHNGLDLAKWDGCIVSAVADGVVEYAGWANGGQGFMVRLNHGGGIKTEYFHGRGDYYTKPGDFVRQGDALMYMGTTGNSTGTHLHFILWKDNYAIDPLPYVPVSY